MKKHLMRTPAIVIISIALPCLLELLLEWMASLPYKFDGAVVEIAMHLVFAIYAGAVGYVRGKKIWRKIAIIIAVFLVQSVVFYGFFFIRFALSTPPSFF
jgi:hypothetical protein